MCASRWAIATAGRYGQVDVPEHAGTGLDIDPELLQPPPQACRRVAPSQRITGNLPLGAKLVVWPSHPPRRKPLLSFASCPWSSSSAIGSPTSAASGR